MAIFPIFLEIKGIKEGGSAYKRWKDFQGKRGKIFM